MNKVTPMFITFEGGDGAGKSTHINFLATILEYLGFDVVCVREPGSTEIGEQIRNLVLDANKTLMAPETELFLYEAARAQLVKEVIEPALREGKIVVCDRFADSTVAYQAFGRGLDKAFIDQANKFASARAWPQATILLKAPSLSDGMRRATKDAPADRLEAAGVDFHERVEQGFEHIAKTDSQRVHVVVSGDTKEQTAREICAHLSALIPGLAEISDEVFQALDTDTVAEVLQSFASVTSKNEA